MIGPGALGLVYKGKFGLDTVVITKVVSELTDGEDYLRKEAKLVKTLKHIVESEDFCCSP